jgi:hypothetical protein
MTVWADDSRLAQQIAGLGLNGQLFDRCPMQCHEPRRLALSQIPKTSVLRPHTQPSTTSEYLQTEPPREQRSTGQVSTNCGD